MPDRRAILDGIAAEISLVRSLARDCPECLLAILFGSLAYGFPHKDSDIDIYLVFDDHVRRGGMDLARSFSSAVWDANLENSVQFRVQFLSDTESEFIRLARGPTLEAQVSRWGIPLFARHRGGDRPMARAAWLRRLRRPRPASYGPQALEGLSRGWFESGLFHISFAWDHHGSRLQYTLGEAFPVDDHLERGVRFLFKSLLAGAGLISRKTFGAVHAWQAAHVGMGASRALLPDCVRVDRFLALCREGGRIPPNVRGLAKAALMAADRLAARIGQAQGFRGSLAKDTQDRMVSREIRRKVEEGMRGKGPFGFGRPDPVPTPPEDPA